MTKKVKQANRKREYINTHTPHEWLDQYVEYSNELSPRGFDTLHEAAGLWALSSVVAGRLLTDVGGKLRHTSLMFVVVSKATIWAKSHTIHYAKSLLSEAGQDWRILPVTPDVRSAISAMSDNEQDYERLYAHERQRAWYITDFGPIVELAAESGNYSFWMTINEMGNHPFFYRRRSNREQTTNPYLSVIAEAAPVILKPYAGAGAPFWLKLLSRFAIIAPAKGETLDRLYVPYQRTNRRPLAPQELISALVKVDQELGRRENYHAKLEKKTISCTQEVWNAIYNYEAWIDRNRLKAQDLDGTYTRLALDQSVAIATLLTVIDGLDEIQMKYYQRAVEVCERIRRCTEDFYIQMTIPQI